VLAVLILVGVLAIIAPGIAAFSTGSVAVVAMVWAAGALAFGVTAALTVWHDRRMTQ
jgi:hypothetical protein